jgi:alanine-glyoxylate transaminase/serine-glyoxylate transaminase/serine-pyruvate transaminase
VLDGLKPIFGTHHPVIIYPASGTGAWEAALVNTMSPGDRVLMCETGQFATLWRNLATRLGLQSWSSSPATGATAPTPPPSKRGSRPTPRTTIRAVCVVHNETSTGVTTRVPDVRAAIDRARHPALLMVDTISSLGSIEYRHDDWGVDVTVAGSQKGLMLPPGLSFNAVSNKALAASQKATMPRSYWSGTRCSGRTRAAGFRTRPPRTCSTGCTRRS